VVLLSFFLNILVTEVFLNLLLRRVHLLLSQTMALIHSSRFFLSDVEEVVWGKESGVGICFGLVVIFDFFCGDNGVGVGDVKWNVFRFLGGSGCFATAAVTSSINWDDVDCGASGMILRGMGSKWESLIFDWNPEDRLFIINWDHDCFVVDVDGVKGFSWSPSGPVELDVKVSMLDEGPKEVELIVVGMHADEDDSIVGAQGEDSRGGEACAGEFVVD